MGLKIDVPGRQTYQVEAIVFDLNGTLTIDGELRSSTRELLLELAEEVSIHILTADTHHSASMVQESLGGKVKVHVLQGDYTLEAKRTLIKELGPGQTAAVGNGANDAGLLEEACLSVAVLEKEGCAAEVLSRANILVRSTDDALKLFLNTRRIIATLRR